MSIECKECLYTTSHPLGLTLNEEGICSGCLIHREKDTLDWDYRLDKLKKITKEYKSTSNKNYDCIVAVTGAQDSYFIVHVVKNLLGLNPLLVNYNKYFNTPLGIKNLANLRIKFDCDILMQNVNPVSVKKITSHTLFEIGSMYWPILAGHSVFPVQTSIRYKIPLIFWGCHQGLEQVGMFSHKHEVEMSRRYRKDHDLMGLEADDLVKTYNLLKEEDIWQYRYPDNFDIEKVGTRGIYLGNFIRWDPKAQHEEMIEKYGYLTSKFNRTFDCYDYVDCFNYMEIHDLLKYFKNGYSKVTDHVSREIRFKRLSKLEGMFIKKKYETTKISYLKQFCDWLGVNQEAIWFVLNQHRNTKYWYQLKPDKWIKKEKSQNIRLSKKVDLKFTINSKLNYNSISKYITIGKGFP